MTQGQGCDGCRVIGLGLAGYEVGCEVGYEVRYEAGYEAGYEVGYQLAYGGYTECGI